MADTVAPIINLQKETSDDLGLVARMKEGREKITRELKKVIVGQDDVIEEVLTALFSGGHCLITGVPGLAKTLLISSLAKVMDLSFNRIQFTPDLMPTDITGSEILEEDHDHAPPGLQVHQGADIRQCGAGR